MQFCRYKKIIERRQVISKTKCTSKRENIDFLLSCCLCLVPVGPFYLKNKILVWSASLSTLGPVKWRVRFNMSSESSASTTRPRKCLYTKYSMFFLTKYKQARVIRVTTAVEGAVDNMRQEKVTKEVTCKTGGTRGAYWGFRHDVTQTPISAPDNASNACCTG